MLKAQPAASLHEAATPLDQPSPLHRTTHSHSSELLCSVDSPSIYNEDDGGAWAEWDGQSADGAVNDEAGWDGHSPGADAGWISSEQDCVATSRPESIAAATGHTDTSHGDDQRHSPSMPSDWEEMPVKSVLPVHYGGRESNPNSDVEMLHASSFPTRAQAWLDNIGSDDET